MTSLDHHLYELGLIEMAHHLHELGLIQMSALTRSDISRMRDYVIVHHGSDGIAIKHQTQTGNCWNFSTRDYGDHPAFQTLSWIRDRQEEMERRIAN